MPVLCLSNLSPTHDDEFTVGSTQHQFCTRKLTPRRKLLNKLLVDCVWNIMANAQKPESVFRRNGLVHLNRRGSQFCWLRAAELCASAVVMLDTPCSEVVWRVLATHSIRQFALHFPSHASPCAITFQLDFTSAAQGILLCFWNLRLHCLFTRIH